MPETIAERVLRVISKTQRIPIEKVTLDSSFEELGIDSMDSINILFDVESEFEIEISDEQAKQIHNVREMVDGITQLLDAKEKASQAT
jgi:acyl carrier protein